MTVYTHGNSAIHGDSLTQTQADVYRSSRLGLLNLSLNCRYLSLADSGSVVRGNKLFELPNHLGNVLEAVSDKKIQHTSDNSTVDYYLADVINANDYYSFGMQMPGRSYTVGSANQYRYGINGKERTDEIAGSGNHNTAEFWEYDTRIGRRWNLDPKPTVGISEYSAFNKCPIWLSDLLWDSTPVRNQIFDNRGTEIKTPTEMNISSGIINPQQFPGLKPLGGNKVLVTPGTFMAESDPTNAVGSITQVFTQVPGDAPGGSLVIWGHSAPPPPPAFTAPTTFQYNILITQVQNVRAITGNINQAFNIDFNGAITSGDAARFANPAAGIAQINTFANRLRRLGLSSGVTITIGTDAPNASYELGQYTNAGGLVAARGAYVQSLFGGIRTSLAPAAYSTAHQITVSVNHNFVGITGWNVTTQAMQRQTLNGSPVPGTTQPVPGSSPAINFQRNTGGRRPTAGSYTGPWQ
jgi:hypothetical protein